MTNNENLIAIIGDIHGCYYTLMNLYTKLLLLEINLVYSVGDLIDRGKYSKEVVQFCIDKEIKPVKGNHEDMMVLAIDNPYQKAYSMYGYSNKEMYLLNGCNKTMRSYINSEDEDTFDVFAKEIKRYGHFDYLKKLPMKQETDGIIISHAGIVNGEPEMKLLWNRDIPSKLNKYQVFGHTSRRECKIEDHYACIDTGCVYGGYLSAIVIDSLTAKIDSVISEPLNKSDERYTLNYY